MKWLTRWFLDNPVAANLLMIVILAGGLLSLGTLRVESFPQMDATELQVSVVYPGGTAKQIDESITQRIEDAVSSVPGISRISSTSQRGIATVTIRKSTGVSLDRLMEDVRNQVNSIVGFPEKAEQPQVYRNEFTNLAAFVLIAGEVSDDVLQQSANRVEQALKKHPAISQVTNLGKRAPELVIEPIPEQLQRFGISSEQLATLVSDWSLEYRSGQLDTAQGMLLLRGDGYADNLTELRNLPVINSENTSIRLAQVANIRRDYEETDEITRFQGEPAVALMVSTSKKDNLFNLSKAVAEVLESLRPVMPAAVQLDVMADMTPYIKDQVNLLSTNAWQGLLIVLIILGIFLELRLAFWVAVGIPVSLAGALSLMGLPGLDYSINDITLFGMILVLGILVDDAVVVGESIHEARGRIADPKAAAQEGVEKVAVATTYGVLTTIAAFSPMLWIENELARMLAGFSVVVILALLFSLIESKFILPSHLSFSKGAEKKNFLKSVLERIRSKCLQSLDNFTRKAYLPVVKGALKYKVSTLVLFVSIVMLAYGLVIKGSIRSVFFPEIPGRYLTANVTMDQDAPLALTQKNAEKLDDALEQANEDIQKSYGLESRPITRHLLSIEGPSGIEVTAELSSEALKKVPGNTLLNDWKERTGLLEGSYAVNFSSAESLAGGTSIAVTAPDRKLAIQVAQELKDSLKSLPGVHDAYDNGKGGQRLLQLQLNERGRQLGLTKRQLAVLAGGAFGGLEVYRLLEQGEETKVLIRFAKSQRRTLDQLKETRVHLGDSHYVSLGEVADISMTREPEAIYRRNREEVVLVYWRQDRAVNSPEETWEVLSTSIVPVLEKRYPGVGIRAVGEFEEMTEVQSGFRKAMLLTLLMIYVLLAVPLKSYWQPLIIMAVIPFGFAGAIFGHGLMGLPVSLLSLFGMMAMTGVVINDSLVLMTRFNQLYKEGMEVGKALVEAARSRLRAIFLTTVTTVFGLLPLLSETSEQAMYLKPAAVSLVFGELFATPITLILIPVLLAFGRYKRSPAPEELESSHGNIRQPGT
ncbi:efflux RND transporter permease subunit [Endozoicomonas arenosclerae]|uniref:efflux RND transporter permease subunit n=1 Tax=Endozoicomonas arenosclerae TaxID=1633495 RepID=UPI000783FC48|nr:efflux RND transporter permease subunit [Endozoicomonas arenosclerae]